MGLKELEELADRLSNAARGMAAITAAFVGGSLASGTADGHSDLDYYLVAARGQVGSVCLLVPELLNGAGTLLLLKRIDHGFPMFLFVYSDGARGEIGVGDASRLSDLHYGPYRVLFDREGVLDGYIFPGWALAAENRQPLLVETLDGFWRCALNAGHYLARGDTWSAAAELGEVRSCLAAMLRWRSRGVSFPDGDLHGLAKDLPAGDLRILGSSFMPLEVRAMQASLVRLCSAAWAVGQTELTCESERRRIAALADLTGTVVPFHPAGTAN